MSKIKDLEWQDSEITDSSVAITGHYIYVIEKIEKPSGLRRYKITINTQCNIIEEFYTISIRIAKKSCDSHWKKFVGGLLEEKE